MGIDSSHTDSFEVCMDRLRAMVRQFSQFGYTRPAIASTLATIKRDHPSHYDDALLVIELELMNQNRRRFRREFDITSYDLDDTSRRVARGEVVYLPGVKPFKDKLD